MEQLRRILGAVRSQLGRLTASQRLLIASLAVVMVMTMFLVSQYAASPTMVELVPTGTPDEQARVKEQLERVGIPCRTNDSGKVVVPAERKYPALAQLARAQALPSDKKVMFNSLASQTSWLMPNKQLDQLYTTALTNELASVIRNFPGVEDASVFVSNPEHAGGLGAAYRKPVAQVTVFPRPGTGLDQTTVNALADLVSGAVSGLDMRDVAIIDGTNKRSHRAVAVDDYFAGTYIEQVAKVESRVQEKIAEHLRFIQDVIVSVNAIVDGAQRRSVETKVLPKGEGTVSLPAEETTTNSTSTSNAKGGAEPGIGSNVGMDISRAGGATGSNTNEESGTNKFENRFGERSVTQVDPRGRPTKINVTISVPRDYVSQVVKQRRQGGGAGGAAKGSGAADAAGGKAPASGASEDPSEDEVRQAWEAADGVKAAIEAQVSPLIETEGPNGAQTAVGTVRAFLIPVAMSATAASLQGRSGAGLFGGSSGTGGSGMMSGLNGLVGSGIVKTAALGGLALFAIGLMLVMVKKASKPSALPTAEELVGIPPALEPNNDVVGEADETETAMPGIEVDPQHLRTSKMLEEVGQLVKSNPNAAASVFGRWLSNET